MLVVVLAEQQQSAVLLVLLLLLALQPPRTTAPDPMELTSLVGDGFLAAAANAIGMEVMAVVGQAGT
jgi:hypothetical protein